MSLQVATTLRNVAATARNGMARILGPLHPETYLHVDEVKGDAYRFGDLTQEGATLRGSSRCRRRLRDVASRG